MDLKYVLEWALPFQQEHSKICNGRIVLKTEDRIGMGLDTFLIFGCTVCQQTFRKYSADPKKKSEVNYGFVWGTLSTGSTFGHSQELLSVMDIPSMSQYMFQKIERDLDQVSKYLYQIGTYSFELHTLSTEILLTSFDSGVEGRHC